MKQELADRKTVMQTVDLGDTEQFDKLVQRANELNNKLKEIEESYGQFGRNVGNYASAAEGFKGIQVNVGGVIREFDNAREASKTLNNELKTMAVNGQTDTDEFKNLRQAVMQMESAMNDAKKPMDDLMDAMESFTAIASVGEGISALFGIDDSEIQRSIQKLLGLQNVLKGIETINKQMETGEGIGSWLSKGSEMADKLAASITGVGKASKGATVATKALGTALKALGIGLLIAAVAELINLYETWSDNQRKAAEEAEAAAEKVKKAVDEQRQAYVSASVSYMNTASRLSYLRTEYKQTNNELRKTNIIKEASEEFKKLGINVKSVSNAQRIFVEDGDKVIQLLKLQGDAAAIAALRMEAFKKSFQMLLENGYDANAASILAGNNKTVLELDKRLGVINDQVNNLKGKLNIGVDGVGKTVSKAVEKNIKEISDLELRLMNDGLGKKLRQLDEEERQTINKIKENGRATGEEIKKIQNAFNKLRENAIKEHIKEIEKSISETAKELSKTEFNLNLENINNQLGSLTNKIDEVSQKVPAMNGLLSRLDLRELLGNHSIEEYNMAVAHNAFKGTGIDGEYRAYYDNLDKFISKQNAEIKNKFNDLIGEDEKKAYEYAEKLFEEKYASLLDIARDYNKNIVLTGEESVKKNTEILNDSFKERLNNAEFYYTLDIEQEKKYLEQQKKLNDELIKMNSSATTEAENQRFSAQMDGLRKQKSAIENALKEIEKKYGETAKNGGIIVEESNKNITTEIVGSYRSLQADLQVIDQQIETEKKQHGQKLKEITEQTNNAITKNEIDSKNEISDLYSNYFSEQISNFRDFQSKVNEEFSRQPILNSWGIVNLPQTKKQFKEMEMALTTTINAIAAEKNRLDALFKAGLITEAAKNATLKELNDIAAAIKQLFASVQYESKQNIPKFIETCQVYVQGALDAFNKIMDAVWDAQSNAIDKEQEQLDKENEMLADKLKEQEDIYEEHKSKVDSIEDELATARGDRRQHLIDQLNAEISAQRAAEAEKEKIEKQQKANEKKQDEIDKKRKKLQYRQQLLQAIINGAMAVTYAALNPWPVPAIPLMAAAGAATAAQIAIMSANKPYAKGGQLDGGVAVGNRHRDGGIKVLGGRAEIEGGEFITNRISTQMNAPLLEFINSKKKKIDASDLIEFYSSGSVRKNISNVRTKFEDGGYMPTLPNTIDIKDQLQNVIINQDNRPIYCSVVDINNKQEQVRRVQVLAGLGEE